MSDQLGLHKVSDLVSYSQLLEGSRLLGVEDTLFVSDQLGLHKVRNIVSLSQLESAAGK